MRRKKGVDAVCEQDFKIWISQTLGGVVGLKTGPHTPWLWDGKHEMQLGT